MSIEQTCRLYLISPAEIDDIDQFTATLTAAFKGGDVASFQLRLKGADDDHITKVAQALIPICHAFDVAFVMNDNPHIAKEVGADALHLGQDDMSVKEARDIVGFNCAIGVTCHNSRHLAFQAGEQGADYVAFGAFFPTTTKEVKHQAELETLVKWSDIAEIPCVAVGGITIDNCHEVVDAGADFIAVSEGVWSHPAGAEDAVKLFNEKLAED